MIFRLTLAVASPLLVLGILELFLRSAGLGHPTGYLVPAQIRGLDRLVDNPHFGRRFFPAGMLRQPPPTVVARDKTPGTVRIVVMGESAAMGDPQPAFGVSRYLEVLLRDRFPTGQFEVVTLAMTAINSHALLAIARDATTLNADFWIVLAGNNEMLGPFGAGSALGQHAPPLPFVRASLAVKSTRLGQLLDDFAQRIRGDAAGSTRWAGLQLFAQQNVPEGSLERDRVYAAFERNLRDIVRLGQRTGAQVVLGSVPVNLRDCAPFGSSPNPPHPGWERLVQEGHRHLAQRNAEGALSFFRQAEGLAPKNATLQFLLGQSELARTNPAAALQHFIRARDLDTVPLRTDSRLNEAAHTVALETGAAWRDHVADLAALAPDGIPGSEYFFEHVHLTPEGNHALARSFAEALTPQLPTPATRDAKPAWASAEFCETRLALSPWNRQDALQSMARRCADPPFTQQINHAAHLQELSRLIAAQRAHETRNAAATARTQFVQAIDQAPDDHHLCRSFAEFLDATGDLDGAIREWRRLAELLPHHFRGWYQAGTDLTRAGRAAEAIPLLQQVVRLQDDWPDAHVALGQALYQTRDFRGALVQYDRALQLDPRLPIAHRHRADALASLGRRPEGLASLEAAVRLDPRFVEARYLLGVEYASLNRVDEARDQFAEVARLQPGNARAHFNLGVALARQTRWDQAATAFRQTLLLDPAHAEAKRMLSKVIALQATPGVPGPTSPTNDPAGTTEPASESR